MAYNYKIPLTIEGDLFPLMPTSNEVYKYNINAEPNRNFDDDLKFNQFVVVKNIVMVELINVNTNATYYMLLDDFEKVLKDDKISKGIIKGIFRFKKTNEYYSVYLRR